MSALALARDRPGTLSWPMAMLAALLVTLARPRWWVLALAGFLVRGGILVAFLPIVALPSIAGLANAFGSVVVGFVFGEPSTGAVILVSGLVLAVGAWLAGSANLGAWLDLVLLSDAARDEELAPGALASADVDPGPAYRAGAVRLLAHVPTAVAIALAAPRIVDATYSELILPADPTVPLLLRVEARVPAAIALVVIAWLLGEAAGGIGVRRLLRGAGIRRAVTDGFAALRHPTTLATLVVTDALLAAVIVPFWLAVGLAFDDARTALVDGIGGSFAAVSVGLFLATWLAGLCIASVALAWRSAAWTAEVLRRD